MSTEAPEDIPFVSSAWKPWEGPTKQTAADRSVCFLVGRPPPPHRTHSCPHFALKKEKNEGGSYVSAQVTLTHATRISLPALFTLDG